MCLVVSFLRVVEVLVVFVRCGRFILGVRLLWLVVLVAVVVCSTSFSSAWCRCWSSFFLS